MDFEKRTSVRYQEIGKFTSLELCALSGVLDDISEGGLKVHYNFPVVVDLENEYDLEIVPSNSPDQTPLKLKCRPLWANEQDGNTYIGFKILYSPDANRLTKFIDYLEQLSKDQLPQIK